MFSYIGQDSGFLKIIIPNLPKSGKVFVEPFGGSGVVTLNVAYLNKYQRYILNDYDKKIYAVYFVYKYRPDILRAVARICSYLADFDDQTLKTKIKFGYLKRLKNLIETKMYWRIEFIGFASLLLHLVLDNPFQKRTTMPRIHMVGAAKKRFKKLEPKLLKIHNIIQRVEIHCDDAFKLIPQFDSEDTVFYIDPPHLGVDYYCYNFDEFKAMRLAKLLTNIKGRALVKYSVYDRPCMQVLMRAGYRLVEEKEYTVKASNKRNRRTYYFLANY